MTPETKAAPQSNRMEPPSFPSPYMWGKDIGDMLDPEENERRRMEFMRDLASIL